MTDLSDFRNATFGFVGLGLMGGSLALALKSIGVSKILAVDKNDDVINLALINGTITEKIGLDALIRRSDIIVLGLYPNDEVEFLKTYGNRFNNGTIVTDVSGLKSELIESVMPLLTGNFDFVSVHPMAGKEVNGFANASATLFQNSSIVITPHCKNSADAINIIYSIYKAVGAKKIIECSAAQHDKMIAYTSHLPHILAVALCMDEQFLQAKNFVGQSFRDMTRVANINEELWSELFVENSENVVNSIDEVIAMLRILQSEIASKDKKRLKLTLKQSRLRKEEV